MSVAVTVKGSMESPDVGVDLKDLGKEIAEDKLREKLLDVLGEDEEKDPDEKESSGDQLRRGLRDLLKR